MTQVEQIKAELERQIKALEKTFPNTYYEGEVCGLKRLLSFIESMEKDKSGGSEKPNSQSQEKNICDGCVNDKGCVTCVDGDMKETQSLGLDYGALDDAAWDYARRTLPVSKKFPVKSNFITAAFMTGARWMAEQGETVEGEIVCAVAHPHENKAIARVNGNYKFGDKVIVQIREK